MYLGCHCSLDYVQFMVKYPYTGLKYNQVVIDRLFALWELNNGMDISPQSYMDTLG